VSLKGYETALKDSMVVGSSMIVLPWHEKGIGFAGAADVEALSS